MTPYSVVHITNDYSGSTVYKNLIYEIDNLGISQIVYNPIRESNRIGKNKIEFKEESSKILYRDILNYHIDRVLFPYKTWKIFRDIQRQVDFSKVKFIHAHTWYSDGGVAYLLSKKYNIPYIVTIRNTDLNLFQKRLRYLHSFGRKILNKAEKVILISASYKERVLEETSLSNIKNELSLKLKVIPNGVDPFWIQNVNSYKKAVTENQFNLLYIGKFNRGKNVPALQSAIILLNKAHNTKIVLNLVGGDGNEEKQVLDLVMKYPSIFTYHGKIYDKDKLLELYRSCHVFTMPSMYETFGLVYVEAMLQGLPILYTRNEGIDGFYDEKIGEAVSIGDIEDIKVKLLLLYSNYSNYKLDIPLLKNNHDWKLIAREYIKLYQS